MWNETGYPVTVALAVALLSACPGEGERHSSSTPEAPRPSGSLGAFGDGAAPDTAPPDEPQAGPASSPPERGETGTSDTAPLPGAPGGPGTTDTALVAPAGPGVMDTAVSGPAVRPHIIWRPGVGTLDTAAAVAPNRRAGTVRPVPLPGVHR